MPRLNIAGLTESRLRDLLLTTNRTLRLVVDAVRANTKDDWKVRREVEKLLDQYDSRIEPYVDRTEVVRSRERREVVTVKKHDLLWEEFDGGPRDPH